MRRAAVIDPTTGLVDAARVAASGLAPLVDLAILDRQGAHGLIGRGVFAPEPALFARALAASSLLPTDSTQELP
jgi:hypothetical protein